MKQCELTSKVSFAHNWVIVLIVWNLILTTALITHIRHNYIKPPAITDIAEIELEPIKETLWR